MFRAMAWLVCVAAIDLLVDLQSECRASARPLEVALEYTAAPECPAAEDFTAIVADRLGYNAFRANAATHVQVEISPLGQAFEGHIEWRNAEGVRTGDRTFPSRSTECSQLAHAMAFSLALQIQFLATDASSKAATTAVVEAAPAPPVPLRGDQQAPPAKLAQSGLPRESGRSVLSCGAGASVGFGLSSAAIPLGRVFLELAWKHVSFELGAAIAWPTTTRRPDGVGFSQDALLVGPASCGISGRARLCALANTGVVRATGKDIGVSASSAGPVFQTGLRFAWMQPLGRRAYVGLLGEGLLNIMRWTVDLDRRPAWTSPRFLAIAGLDAGVRFP